MTFIIYVYEILICSQLLLIINMIMMCSLEQ